ncbi:MAG: LAGLIDADG family homing endonuclease [Gaiellaceae bacterium]
MSGAANQQERLIEFRGWVIGFVDGEGCFSLGFVRQPSRPGRKGYATGFQVSHEFAVTQGASGVECLRDLREFFGDEPEETQARSHQNPQRPYARRPRHRMMRWSRLHGDMQGWTSKEVFVRSAIQPE